MSKKIFLIALVCLLFFRPAIQALATDTSYNYESLPPIVQYLLYEKNGLQPVTKERIATLLPIQTVDMSGFYDLSDLELVKSLPLVERLVIGPFVGNFEVLKSHPLQHLYKLDASFSFMSSADLRDARLPSLSMLDISGSKVRDLSFVEQFPSLRTIVLIKHQVAEAEVERVRLNHPNINIVYNDSFKPISRNFYYFEFEPYISLFGYYFSLGRRVPSGIEVEIDINQKGFVKDSRFITSTRRLHDHLQHIFELMVFEPAPEEETTVMIPVKIHRN
jgi:hypothetical protein